MFRGLNGRSSGPCATGHLGQQMSDKPQSGSPLISPSAPEKRSGTAVYRVSRGNVPDFGRMFLTLKYTDITQNTYVYPKLNGYGDNGERSLKV